MVFSPEFFSACFFVTGESEQVESKKKTHFFSLFLFHPVALKKASPPRLNDLQRLAAPGHGQLRGQDRAVHQPERQELGHRRRHHRLDQKGAAEEQGRRGAGE